MNQQVAIVIPSFNNEAFLGQTLASVLAQEYKHWQCLIVDDHSTDNTQLITNEFCQKDSRFVSLSRPDDKPKGANSCRNYGLQQATANWIVFLDADDLLAPTALAGRVEAFNSYPEYQGLVFSARSFNNIGSWDELINKDPDKETNAAYLSNFLSYNIPWQTSCPIWKREYVLEFGGFNESYKRFQDVEFHTRLLLAGAKVKRVHQVDFYYRIPQENSKYKDKAFLELAYKAIQDYMLEFSSSELQSRVLNVQQRRDLLFKMLNKIIMSKLIPTQQWHSVNGFLRVAKAGKIISSRQAFAIMLYVFLQRSGWHKIKGIGTYSIYRWALNNSKLHKPE